MSGRQNTDADIALTLRPCKIRDAQILFDWRNHPAIVALSTGKTTVTWSEHLAWLKNRLSRPQSSQIFIACLGNEAIGAVRFDRTEKEVSIVSVYLDPAYFGSGLGSVAIRDATLKVLEVWPSLERIEAHVLSDNVRAARAFSKAGYTLLAQPARERHLLFIRSKASISSEAH